MTEKEASDKTNWGPWLFVTVAVLSLVFFWWLLIYPHGVAIHHG